MKYIRINKWTDMRYEWASRETGARCLNQNATLLPSEAYQFAMMEREKTLRAEAQGAIFEIEGLAAV